MERLELELATMKIMIYSLKDCCESIYKALDKKYKIVENDVWEKDCENVAKDYLKKIKESEDVE